ncbi:conserved hypothetical protein [Culex quinquefasciatus]|uniref:Ig-like domain-containing protein n=1 Tax=Culex quinquefasciatus TaxID=7176 RepID=B0XC13_CULQU|nr:conserved hypothetical protein [Culex quinquefasciatus]|eukprot:XP_001867185.1 conserved hypothetical protein [Culex quinquefasciatus]
MAQTFSRKIPHNSGDDACGCSSLSSTPYSIQTSCDSQQEILDGRLVMKVCAKVFHLPPELGGGELFRELRSWLFDASRELHRVVNSDFNVGKEFELLRVGVPKWQLLGWSGSNRRPHVLTFLARITGCNLRGRLSRVSCMPARQPQHLDRPRLCLARPDPYHSASDVELQTVAPKFMTRGHLYKAIIGDSIELPCKVKDLGSYVLLWRRGTSVLTAANLMVTRDARFKLIEGYNLQIANVKIQDAGDYICQIGDNESRDQVHTLEISGTSDDTGGAPEQANHSPERQHCHDGVQGFWQSGARHLLAQKVYGTSCKKRRFQHESYITMFTELDKHDEC